MDGLESSVELVCVDVSQDDIIPFLETDLEGGREGERRKEGGREGGREGGKKG